MKKFTFLLIALFSGIVLVSAQTACPTPPPPGSDCTNCPQLNVSAEGCIECDTLKFVWGYQYPNCSGTIGAGYIIPGSGPVPSNPWTAPCLQFCDDPCKCPISFYLLDPNNGSLLEPWGPIVTWGSTTITYTDIVTCGSTTVKVEITQVGGIWNFAFKCQ